MRDSAGWTCLYAACFYGYPEKVKLLIEHGADINLADKCGKTALDVANKYGFSDLATIIEQEQKRRLIEEKQVLEKERLLEYLQRKNAENLKFILLYVEIKAIQEAS